MERLIDSQLKNIEKAYDSIPMGGKLEFSKSAVESFYQVLKELREYKDAEEQGLLVRLPCKMGDTVYLLSNPINITDIEEDYDENKIEVYECVFKSFTKYWNGNIQIRLCHNGKFVGWYLTPEHFGEVIFLTRSEAEQSLQQQSTPAYVTDEEFVKYGKEGE